MASPSFAPKASSGQRITLAHIDEVVSTRLGPTRGLGKSQPACFNRQVAMYLASHIGRWSTTVIGRFYGGRDHSTVVHAIQRIEAMRDAEPDLDVLLSDLKSRIGTQVDTTNDPAVTRLTIRRPTPKESEIRLFAREFAAQVRELIREELRAVQVRDFGGEPGE